MPRDAGTFQLEWNVCAPAGVRGLRRIALATTFFCLSSWSAVFAATSGDVTLWVVQPPGVIAAFDPSDFSQIGAVRIPVAAFEHPDRLTINGHGQILVRLGDWAIWLWDSRSSTARTLAPSLMHRNPPVGITADSSRSWLLGADGSSLFVAESFGWETGPVGEEGDSMIRNVHVDRLDLSGHPIRRELDLDLEHCDCRTSVCSESCPEVVIWTPDGVVRDAFYLMFWTQGQIESSFGPSFVYRADSTAWRPTEIDVSPYLDLDLQDFGRTSITKGAEPQGDDDEPFSHSFTFTAGDSVYEVFDEWQRFHNQGFAVSFECKSGKIAPDGQRIAYVLNSRTDPALPLGVIKGSHPDTLQAPHIRRALAEMPRVEVFEPQSQSRVAWQEPNSQLVGWLSDSEVLVVERGKLVAIDVNTRLRRSSSIPVRSPGDAFVVRP